MVIMVMVIFRWVVLDLTTLKKLSNLLLESQLTHY